MRLTTTRKKSRDYNRRSVAMRAKSENLNMMTETRHYVSFHKQMAHTECFKLD